MFAYLLGLKEPRMVVGYGGLEIDIALEKGEVDVRANGADYDLPAHRGGLSTKQSRLSRFDHDSQRKFHPRRCPKSGSREFRQKRSGAAVDQAVSRFSLSALALYRAAGNAQGSCVDLARRNGEGFKDPGFHTEFKKLMTTDPTPLTGEQMEAAIRELPRDRKPSHCIRKWPITGPLPAR